jgi:hypothetical protein
MRFFQSAVKADSFFTISRFINIRGTLRHSFVSASLSQHVRVLNDRVFDLNVIAGLTRNLSDPESNSG